MTARDRRQFLRTSLGAAAAVSLGSQLELAPALTLKQTFRVGLVGCGRQGRTILTELAKWPAVEVVGLADPVESRRNSALRRAKGAVGYASPGELFEAHPDLDAVIVATPTHLHVEPALAALAAGHHVYCEAPMAHTLEDAKRLAEAAKNSSKVFQVGQLGRVNPIYNLAWKFYRSGSIGDLVALRSRSAEKTTWTTPVRDAADQKALNWRTDAEVSLGLPGELGVHQFDVFHWFTGEYPTSVRGNGSIRLHKDGRQVPDTVSTSLRFADGTQLGWEATIANSFDGSYEQFEGAMGTFKLGWTHGWLFKEADSPTQGWEVYANRQSVGNEQGITLIADATKLAAQNKLKDGVGLPESSLWYGLEAFIKSCTEGSEVACGASEGARSLMVALAATEAVRTGAEVAIDAEVLNSL